MYKRIIRPLLFLCGPEKIHHILVKLIGFSKYIPFAGYIMRRMFRVNDPRLEREVLGLNFPNPIGLSAGFDKNAEIYNELYNLGFGFIEIGTVPPKAQAGNPKPRVFRLIEDQAIINRMGLNSKGVKQCVKNLKSGKKHNFIIAGNIGKNTDTPNERAVDDYLASFRALYDYVDFFVVNLSCPNVKNLTKLQDSENQTTILNALVTFRRGQSEFKPILVKISPDLTNSQIDDTIEVMKQTNVDGIVATNTTTSRDMLKTPKDRVESIGMGGLSGAPLTKRSIEIVRYISNKTNGDFPIIGVGGVMSTEDALAMLDAGASLIQVYSGFIYNGPNFVKKISNAILDRERSE